MTTSISTSFNSIPAALRYPGVYIEFDNSLAGSSNKLKKLLLVGYSRGSAITGKIKLLSSLSTKQVAKDFGEGSMLFDMVEIATKNHKSLDVYALPIDDASGVSAEATIEVKAEAKKDGVASFSINQKKITITTKADDELDEIALKLADEFNNNQNLGVTASATDAIVTLTYNYKGEAGNDIRVIDNNKTNPAIYEITNFSGGAGKPDLSDIADVLGNDQFNYIAAGFVDVDSIAAIENELAKRYQPPIQKGGRLFYSTIGDKNTTITYSTARNSPHATNMVRTPKTEQSGWVWAAANAMVAAEALSIDPSRSLESKKLNGIVGPSDYWVWNDANSLLYKGVAIGEVGSDGSFYVKYQATTYQTKPDGSADNSYLDIQVVEVLESIRDDQIFNAKAKFTGTKAAKSSDGYGPGMEITTIDEVKAMLLNLYKDEFMFKLGWVADYENYKETLVVLWDDDNPGTFHFKDQPRLTAPFRVLAGKTQFLR